MPRPPTPAEILGARTRARLSMADAAARVSTSEEIWESWEAGLAEMNPSQWVLFLESLGLDGGIDFLKTSIQ